MSKITLLERYYMLWRTEQLDIRTFLMNLESRIQELDERILRLESETLELKELVNKNNSSNNRERIWIKIRGYAIENTTSILLNPSSNFRFKIVEVDDDFIRIDKLGKIRLTKDMFLSVFMLLKEKKDWIRIGASVKNTKPDTVEGHIKSLFFKGDMNGKMSASWISAILVKSTVGIIFNNKAIGQAIKYVGL
ncbi:hypothetical protein MCGE09_00576 [Thaumarchaeota archaeon SCGC AB-539-E09]|nr:hypothetical protein MCGE09_00576 [Thaumarchaeota archaeon SCGC AB-539-E09]